MAAPIDDSGVFATGDPVTATVAISFDSGDARRESRFVVTTPAGCPEDSAVAIGRELGQLFLGVYGPAAWGAALTALADVANDMADDMAED